MGAGGLWVRTAHTTLSGGLALGLFLHRTGEAEPPLPSPHTRPRRGREREGGRGGVLPAPGEGAAEGRARPWGEAATTAARAAPAPLRPGGKEGCSPPWLGFWALRGPLRSEGGCGALGSPFRYQVVPVAPYALSPPDFSPFPPPCRCGTPLSRPERKILSASQGTTALFFGGYLSDLQKQEERGELLQPLIFVLLVLCSVLLYFKVSLMDPGFVKAEEEAKV